MAHINRLAFLRHLRAEPNQYILHYRSGKLVRSGVGLAYWFTPLSAAVAQVPADRKLVREAEAAIHFPLRHPHVQVRHRPNSLQPAADLRQVRIRGSAELPIARRENRVEALHRNGEAVGVAIESLDRQQL